MRRSLALLVTCAAATAALLMTPPGAPPDSVAPLWAVSFGAFFLLMVTEHRRSMLSARTVLLASAFLTVLAVVRPLHGSHDVRLYEMYGRIVAVHHSNPYVHPPSDFARDPTLSLVPAGWRHTPSLYGPGFTLVAAAVASVARSSTLAARMVFQGISGGALLCCGYALARLRVARWSLVALMLNPLVLISTASGGHNDALVAAGLLAAAVALDRRRLWLTGVALAAAMSVKLVAILPAAAAVAWTWKHHGRRAAILVGATCSVPVVVGYAAFGGLRALRPLLSSSQFTSRASMWSLLKHVPGVGGHVGTAAVVVVGAVTIVLVASCLDSPSPAAPIAAGAIGYLVAAAYVLPWYMVWALPVAVLGKSPRLLRLALVYSAGLAMAYVYRPSVQLDDLDRVLRACVAGTEGALLVGCVGIVLFGALAARNAAMKQFAFARLGRPK
jgi:hypothetical protein